MTGASCDEAASVDEGVSAEEAFEQDYSDFADRYGGDGKNDIFKNLGIDPCLLLEPMAKNVKPLTHSGLVMGAEVEVGTGATKGFYGRDYVWDLYHHQLTVSRYYGAGVTSGIAAGKTGATAYVGAAFNFDHGVSDWDGYFVTAAASFGLELELPFVGEVDASITPAFYVTAEDKNGNHVIDSHEEVIFPNGVYGFTVGLSTGAEYLPVPDPVPFLEGELSLTEGLWEPDNEAIRDVYDELDDARILFFWDLQVRLVDHHTGEDCLEANPDWPYEPAGYSGPHLECVVEFGDPEESHLKRSLDTGASICELSGDCAVPLTWPLASTALAVGFSRDLGASVGEYCGFDDDHADDHADADGH